MKPFKKARNPRAEWRVPQPAGPHNWYYVDSRYVEVFASDTWGSIARLPTKRLRRLLNLTKTNGLVHRRPGAPASPRTAGEVMTLRCYRAGQSRG